MLFVKNENEFKEILLHGKSIQSRFFTVKYIFTKSELDLKIGIIISKKVAKQAVKRNKARRRIKAALGSLNIKLKGLSVVFLTKREIIEAEYKEIFSELENVLGKLL